MDKLLDKLDVFVDKLTPENFIVFLAISLAGFCVYAIVKVIEITHKK